jgi:iron(III) transport system permease protein
LVTTGFAVAIGILTVRYQSRWSSIFGRLVWLTHAMPGIVVALALVFLSNRLLPGIYQTNLILLIAYLALYLPNALSAVSTPLSQAPKSLDEVAQSLGASRLSVLRKVVLPIAGPGILLATLLVTLTVLKELPATLMLRPTGIETLATRLWSETSVGAFSAAAPYALLLVVVAGIPAWLLNRQIRSTLRQELERE